jgi:hypothetical protein
VAVAAQTLLALKGQVLLVAVMVGQATQRLLQRLQLLIQVQVAVEREVLKPF